MTDLLDDTWFSRDFPVLIEVTRRCDERPRSWIEVSEIVDALDMPQRDVEHAVLALRDDGYFKTYTEGGQVVSTVGQLHPKARRATGMWPTPGNALERMIDALDEIAENTDDEDTRSNARRTVDWLRRNATTVGVGVATAVLTGHLPGAS